MDKLCLLCVMSRPLLRVSDDFIANPKYQKKEEEDQKAIHGESLPSSSSSSSCSSCSQDEVKIDDKEATSNAVDAACGVDGDDDDGYQTPTSPQHRIPEVAKCPPPPRKKAWSGKRHKEFWQQRRGGVVVLVGDFDIDIGFKERQEEVEDEDEDEESQKKRRRMISY